MLVGLAALSVTLGQTPRPAPDWIQMWVEWDRKSGDVCAAGRAAGEGPRTLVTWKGRPQSVERLSQPIKLGRDGSISVDIGNTRTDKGEWRLVSFTPSVLEKARPLFLCSMAIEPGGIWPARFRFRAKKRGRAHVAFLYVVPGAKPTQRFSFDVIVR